MHSRLPIFVNPEHVANRGYKTSGLLKLESMSRLHDRIVPPFGEVEVDLEFGKYGDKMFLRGSVHGKAIVQCQRCLQTMNVAIDTEFYLGLIFSEAEIASLLPSQEPLLLDESNKEELRLADVVEEELELLLPMVAKHAEGQCQPSMLPAKERPQEQRVKTSKKNPFAVLVDLKKR